MASAWEDWRDSVKYLATGRYGGTGASGGEGGVATDPRDPDGFPGLGELDRRLTKGVTNTVGDFGAWAWGGSQELQDRYGGNIARETDPNKIASRGADPVLGGGADPVLGGGAVSGPRPPEDAMGGGVAGAPGTALAGPSMAQRFREWLVATPEDRGIFVGGKAWQPKDIRSRVTGGYAAQAQTVDAGGKVVGKRMVYTNRGGATATNYHTFGGVTLRALDKFKSTLTDPRELAAAEQMRADLIRSQNEQRRETARNAVARAATADRNPQEVAERVARNPARTMGREGYRAMLDDAEYRAEREVFGNLSTGQRQRLFGTGSRLLNTAANKEMKRLTKIAHERALQYKELGVRAFESEVKLAAAELEVEAARTNAETQRAYLRGERLGSQEHTSAENALNRSSQEKQTIVRQRGGSFRAMLRADSADRIAYQKELKASSERRLEAESALAQFRITPTNDPGSPFADMKKSPRTAFFLRLPPEQQTALAYMAEDLARGGQSFDEKAEEFTRLMELLRYDRKLDEAYSR